MAPKPPVPINKVTRNEYAVFWTSDRPDAEQMIQVFLAPSVGPGDGAGSDRRDRRGWRYRVVPDGHATTISVSTPQRGEIESLVVDLVAFTGGTLDAQTPVLQSSPIPSPASPSKPNLVRQRTGTIGDDKVSNPLQKWIIGLGIAVTVVGGWFVIGQAGRPLQDGDYGCKDRLAASMNLPAYGGPGATVKNGEVVDVWDFDMSTGTRTSVPWRAAERQSSTEFTVSVAFQGRQTYRDYVCSV